MKLISVLRFVFSLLCAVCGGAAAACGYMWCERVPHASDWFVKMKTVFLANDSLIVACFLLNVIVPISVDYSPMWHQPPSLSSSPILNDILLLAMFYGSHSLLARDSVKQILYAIIPESVYRPVYVLCSAGTLACLVYCWQPVGPYIWKVDWTPVIIFLHVVNCLNWILLGLAFLSIEPLTFIGLFTSKSSKAVTEERPKLVQTGLYRFVRHPMYTGVIVAVWAVPIMTLGHLIISLSATVYMWVAVVYLEEPDLIKTFGEEYRQYMKRTPRFVPDIRNSWRL